ncbi:MAG TPA: S53 family peptidase, partial [Gaiellaceae bacterium]|nr:S53 family peptidase [Gaiellaceae bacterium]
MSGKTGVVVVAVGVVLAVGTGLGRAAGGGSPPERDHGRGHWFHRACSVATAGFAQCDAQIVTDAGGTPLASPSPPAGAYGPTQFHTGYSLPTVSAAATAPTIAIVDAYDDPNVEADLGTFDTNYGLPACTTVNGCFRKVDQTGGTSYPATDSGWALEISLDVQAAHEICQNCHILLVEANSNATADLGAAENEAAVLGANVISNSWGGTEYSGETSDDSTYFNHPGIAIVASSGDNGYGVQYPAASKYVTAAGGTTLNLNPDNTYASESAWADGGSGCSAYEPKPSWQADAGCSHRTVADVAADADPNTGAAIYDSVPDAGQSGWYQVGGTSLAAPLLASVYALAGNTGSISNGSAPYGYAGTGSLHDVTTGSNGSCSPTYLCNAGAGYDAPTGVGTPNGTAAFSGTAADGSGAMVVSPTSVTAGSSGNTLTFTYTAAGSGLSSGGISVTVPAGWSAPSTTGSAAGYTTSTCGTVAVSSSTIQVTAVTLAGGHGCTITYGSKASSGPGAAAQPSLGTASFATVEKSTAGGTLTALAASPSVSVNAAADGSGAMVVSPTSVTAGASGITLTFTYTAATGGLSSGGISVTVPA